MRKTLYVFLMATIAAALLVLAGCSSDSGGGGGTIPTGPVEKAQIVYRLDLDQLTPEAEEALQGQEIIVLQSTTPDVTRIGAISLEDTELTSEIDAGVVYYTAFKVFNEIFYSKSVKIDGPGTLYLTIGSQELRLIKITGRVVNKETGEPAAGLRLELMSPSGTMYSATTDENGEFVVYGLEVAVSLDHSGEGYESGSTTINGEDRLEIEVSPKTVPEQLATATFRANPDWELEVWENGEQLAVADAAGVATVRNVSPGTHTYEFVAWGYKPATYTHFFGAGESADLIVNELPEEWDLNGEWWNSDGETIVVSMRTVRDRPAVWFKGDVPISWYWVKGNRLLWSSKSGDRTSEGVILNNGRRIEFLGVDRVYTKK